MKCTATTAISQAKWSKLTGEQLDEEGSQDERVMEEIIGVMRSNHQDMLVQERVFERMVGQNVDNYVHWSLKEFVLELLVEVSVKTEFRSEPWSRLMFQKTTLSCRSDFGREVETGFTTFFETMEQMLFFFQFVSQSGTL